MTISMSSATLPVCTRMLTNLSHILAKAEQFVETKKIDPAALTAYRLSPDMFPFTRQVLIACDAVKNGVARLSGVEAPKFEDTETTLAELQERIQKTLAFIATVPARVLDGTVPRRSGQNPHPERPGLPDRLDAAQYVLSHHHGLRHPAPQRGGGRQDRLPVGRAGLSCAARD